MRSMQIQLIIHTWKKKLIKTDFFLTGKNGLHSTTQATKKEINSVSSKQGHGQNSLKHREDYYNLLPIINRLEH